jgi:hypothetical protein
LNLSEIGGARLRPGDNAEHTAPAAGPVPAQSIAGVMCVAAKKCFFIDRIPGPAGQKPLQYPKIAWITGSSRHPAGWRPAVLLSVAPLLFFFLDK